MGITSPLPGMFPILEGKMSAYTDNGFANRKEYLESLMEEYPADLVMTLAGLLGPEEDFDGLVTMLEDYDGELG